MANFLSPKEQQLYQAHLALDSLGYNSQLKLKQAKIICIGAGGLAASALLYLTTSGIGVIAIVDDDLVEYSNLGRQVLFTEADIGKPKSAVVATKLALHNPNIKIINHCVNLNATNATELLQDYDLVLDCADNRSTSLLINKSCLQLNIAWIYAAIYHQSGQLAVFAPNNPCYACLFPEIKGADIEPASCSQEGVLATAVGVFGIMQANEVIKFVTGNRQNLSTFWSFDLQTLIAKTYTISKNNSCIECGSVNHAFSLANNTNTTNGYLDDDDDLANLGNTCAVDVKQAKKMLQQQDLQLIDVRELYEYQGFNIGGLSIPLGQLESELVNLDASLPTLVICAHGIRSARALTILHQAGFSNLAHLKQGLARWQH